MLFVAIVRQGSQQTAKQNAKLEVFQSIAEEKKPGFGKSPLNPGWDDLFLTRDSHIIEVIIFSDQHGLGSVHMTVQVKDDGIGDGRLVA